jgi:hypothetical protein
MRKVMALWAQLLSDELGSRRSARRCRQPIRRSSTCWHTAANGTVSAAGLLAPLRPSTIRTARAAVARAQSAHQPPGPRWIPELDWHDTVPLAQQPPHAGKVFLVYVLSTKQVHNGARQFVLELPCPRHNGTDSVLPTPVTGRSDQTAEYSSTINVAHTALPYPFVCSVDHD